MSSELPTLLQGEVLKQGASALKFFHPRYIVLKNDGTLWSFKSRNDFTAWKGAKQLLRLEHKRGTVGRVPGSPTDFFVARGKKKEFFREANLAKVNEWLDAAQHIIDPSETPAVVTPRASAGSSARDSDGGPNFAGGGAKGSTSPFDQSDDEDAEDGERSRSGSNDGMSPKDDSYQTASELSNAAVDTTGLFDIHFPVSSMGRKWPPLRQRNVNLQVRFVAFFWLKELGGMVDHLALGECTERFHALVGFISGWLHPSGSQRFHSVPRFSFEAAARHFGMISFCNLGILCTELRTVQLWSTLLAIVTG